MQAVVARALRERPSDPVRAVGRWLLDAGAAWGERAEASSVGAARIERGEASSATDGASHRALVARTLAENLDARIDAADGGDGDGDDGGAGRESGVT